ALISGGDGQQHYEIFEGITTDDGATWSWVPLTYDSTTDNIRPVTTAISATTTSLAWMRGTYTSYTSYNTNLVGLIIDLTNPNSASILKWTGALSGEWSTANLANPKNWTSLGSGNAADYIDHDSLTFDDSGTT